MKLNYLLEKIKNAKFSDFPFKHIYIENFFDENDFQDIIKSSDISFLGIQNDETLIQSLIDGGYKIIKFPGCITNLNDYLKWRNNKDFNGENNFLHTACEGFGMTLRLFDPIDSVISDIKSFIDSPEFNQTIAEKFSINFNECSVDTGIQKYLDGYEISPHPDIRRKAATFMVNINPTQESEQLDHHTHYLKFKESHMYVQKFWEGNPNVERTWVPWNWCNTEFQQKKNNSIVIFTPGNDTMHGVKANYNHLLTQRTQLYGNIWYDKSDIDYKLDWEGLRFELQGKEAAKQAKGKNIGDRNVPKA